MISYAADIPVLTFTPDGTLGCQALAEGPELEVLHTGCGECGSVSLKICGIA